MENKKTYLLAMLCAALGNQAVADDHMCSKSSCCEESTDHVFNQTDLKDDYKSFAKLDLLYYRAYWRPAIVSNTPGSELNGSSLGNPSSFTNSSVYENSNLVSQHGKYYDMDFEWRPGVRAAIGYKLHDMMDAVATFTYVRGFGELKLSATTIDSGVTGTVLIPSVYGINSSCFSQSSHYRSNLYLADLEIGRHFRPSSWLDVRPSIGMRGFYFDQDLYSYVHQNATLDHHIDSQNHFGGIGIRAGLNTLWGLKCGFSVYGNYATSIMTVWHDQPNQDKRTNSTELTTDKSSNYVQNYGPINGTNEMAIGIQYDWFNCNNRYHVGLNVGYEMLSFLNNGQIFSFSESEVTYSGVSAGLRFDY